MFAAYAIRSFRTAKSVDILCRQVWVGRKYLWKRLYKLIANANGIKITRRMHGS